MATLFIHAGHTKTGTSYIQHVLRSNKQVLAENGIIYGIGDDFNIEPGKTISAGNAVHLFNSRENFSDSLKSNHIPDKKSLIYTCEAIFRKFIEAHAEDFVEEIAFNNGFDRIKILIFIRNPISYLVSDWQQRIKRRGETDLEFADIENSIYHGTRWILLMESWLDRMKNCPSVELTILNYSTCADRILEKVTEWMELPAGILNPTSLKRVNRSMTYSELQLLTDLNRVIGKSNLLSDPLCQEIPDIEPDLILPPLEVQQAIWKYVEPVISRINPQIPEGSRYQCDIRPPEPRPEVLYFTHEQIRVIAESLGNEILDRQNESTIRQKEIEQLKLEIMELRAKLEEFNLSQSSHLPKPGLIDFFALNMNRLYNSAMKPFKNICKVVLLLPGLVKLSYATGCIFF